jgi:hypothetical protein
VSLATIRAGLAANIATISGLRVSAEIPDNPSPPVAVIMLQSVNYDLAMHKGATTYNFQVTVLVGRVAEREAQRRLDQYITPGTSSVKDAIESDRTLGGSAFDCRVTDMSDISNVVLEQTYLSATFSVQVLAS